MAEPLDRLTLPLGEAASLLLLSPRRLQQLTKEGHAPKPERGRYHLVALLQGYLRFIRAQERVEARDADEELKQLRVERERMRLARDLKQLIPLEDAQHHSDVLAGLVGTHVNNIPARFTRDLDQRDRLQEVVDEALTKVAEGLRKHAEALRAGGDADPANPEDAES